MALYFELAYTDGKTPKLFTESTKKKSNQTQTLDESKNQ